jgi:hypothetical protein
MCRPLWKMLTRQSPSLAIIDSTPLCGPTGCTMTGTVSSRGALQPGGQGGSARQPISDAVPNGTEDRRSGGADDGRSSDGARRAGQRAGWISRKSDLRVIRRSRQIRSGPLCAHNCRSIHGDASPVRTFRAYPLGWDWVDSGQSGFGAPGLKTGRNAHYRDWPSADRQHQVL